MNKIMVCLALLLVAGAARAEEKKPVTLKSILLEQLRTTHNQKEWFVPADVALQGVTAEQASWRDGKGNHSIGQLAYHLVFWNQQSLAKFKGEQPAKFSGNNEADEEKLKAAASEIAHIGTHNAYHIGQIVYIRRLQGSWDPEKGVK